jgi:glycosyltransferase involved in cell wall biosynthesis
MRKLLIITYYWPPSGGAGVQRWLKFTKYLPQYGWQLYILTVDPAYATWPSIDKSLEAEVDAGLKIFRTKATDWFKLYSGDKSKIPSAGFAKSTDQSLKGKIARFIRGNFFIPDPRRGWNRHALKKASELIATENITHIITSSPPHSSQLIGLKIKRKYPSLTWIADLRDTWTDIYYYKLFYPTVISKAIDKFYERKVIRKADRIISVGNNLASAFASKVKDADRKLFVVPNGYDEQDFDSVPRINPERFTITYSGTISESYPVGALLKALSELRLNKHDFLLRFVGSVPEHTANKISSIIGSSNVEFLPYMEHKEAVRLICTSSLLLLIIPEAEKNNAITPGKVFEYIATGKPVLYIGPPDGDAAYHLKRCGHKSIFTKDASEEIREFIQSLTDEKDQMIFAKHPEYSRQSLAGEIHRILELTHLDNHKFQP